MVRSKVAIEDIYALKPKAIWQQFCSEHFSFWMICGYLFVEYVRPQSIVPALDLLPWGKVFVLLALLGMVFDKSVKWVKLSITKWLIAFELIILISSQLAVYPDVSWSHFFDYLNFLLFFLLTVNIVNSESRFLLFFYIFLLASFKLSLHSAKVWAMRGFAFADWGLAGPPGYFQNSGELAIQMLVFFPLAHQFCVISKRGLNKLGYGILLFFPLTAVMTVIGASSRGAQIALLAQLLMIYVKKISIKSMTIAVVAISIAYWFLPAEQMARFSSAGADRTSQQRVLYWKHAYEMIRDHPAFGVGFYNFPSYYEANYHYDMLYSHAELPHNIFMQVGTDAGLIGLFVYFVILFKGYRACSDLRRLETEKQPKCIGMGSALKIAMIGFLIAGQFVTVTYYPFLWMNLALTFSLKNILQARDDGATQKRRNV